MSLAEQNPPEYDDEPLLSDARRAFYEKLDERTRSIGPQETLDYTHQEMRHWYTPLSLESLKVLAYVHGLNLKKDEENDF